MSERYLEQNTARLVRASFGPHARPSRQATERSFRLLLAQVRARTAVVTFPDAAVGIMGATLALAATWLALQAAIAGTPVTTSPSLLALVAWLVANLALVPVASLVILIRRRHG